MDWRNLVCDSIICARCHGTTPLELFSTPCRRVGIPRPLLSSSTGRQSFDTAIKMVLAEVQLGFRNRLLIVKNEMYLTRSV